MPIPEYFDMPGVGRIETTPVLHAAAADAEVTEGPGVDSVACAQAFEDIVNSDEDSLDALLALDAEEELGRQHTVQAQIAAEDAGRRYAGSPTGVAALRPDLDRGATTDVKRRASEITRTNSALSAFYAALDSTKKHQNAPDAKPRPGLNAAGKGLAFLVNTASTADAAGRLADGKDRNGQDLLDVMQFGAGTASTFAEGHPKAALQTFAAVTGATRAGDKRYGASKRAAAHGGWMRESVEELTGNETLGDAAGLLTTGASAAYQAPTALAYGGLELAEDAVDAHLQTFDPLGLTEHVQQGNVSQGVREALLGY